MLTGIFEFYENNPSIHTQNNDIREKIIGEFLEKEAKDINLDADKHFVAVIAFCDGVIEGRKKMIEILEINEDDREKTYDPIYALHSEIKMLVTGYLETKEEEKHEQTRPQARRNICRP